MALRWLIAISLLVCIVSSGCSRRDYRRRADADAFALLQEKTEGTPWQLLRDYNVYPTPGSRLADPSNPDFPVLPPPGPVLFDPSPISAAGEVDPDALPPTDIPRLIGSNEAKSLNGIRLLPPLDTGSLSSRVRLITAIEELDPPEPLQDADVVELEKETRAADVQPIPDEYWQALPINCLERMLEFTSIREEYVQTYGRFPSPQATETPLSLNDIVRLARENSREYQTEKENLYVAALGVSLDRYDYYLKFTPDNNGGDVDYEHVRVNGVAGNFLRIPSRFQMERMLATGGTFLARFANDVLLTFNGPDGFAADVASELLFDFTQSILQRDVLLEPLIQSERNLVYTARSFTRYRKNFFFDLADQYYRILLSYRNIEIDSKNYFSLVRTVEQAQAEVRAGVRNAPNQVAVDQFEQSMLQGRSKLIERANGLESRLDQLKFTMGLPTEANINISLDELGRLTLLDEIEVAAERVRRWARRVRVERNRNSINRGDLLSPDYFLLERLLEWNRLRQQAGMSTTDLPELQLLLLQLRVDLAMVDVELAENELTRTLDPQSAQPTILLYQRTSDLIAAKLDLIQKQFERLSQVNSSLGEFDREQIDRQIGDLNSAYQQLQERISTILENPEQGRLDTLLAEAQTLLQRTTEVDNRLRDLSGISMDETEAEKNEKTLAVTDQLLELTTASLEKSDGGLPAINITENDALLTALIQRLDLMNERGFLADDWRNIKYAADDLRSVLTFNATHRLRTDKNSVFDFDFDDSSTNVRVSLDLPLNRRAQRNRYRASLLTYQQGRRDLMRLEDQIKLNVREELRGLANVRVQYPINVTQAALAAEQVISVQLQLALGIEGVRGTDLLLALDSSRNALSEVANRRIGYLLDRTRFVLDLELMQLDPEGFWPDINDPNYQPEARTLYPPNAGPTYGTITPWVKPSRVLYQIYQHPLPGQQTVFIESESSPSNQTQSPTPSALEVEEIEAAPLPPRPLTEELPGDRG